MESKKNILIISLHADPMLPAGISEYGGGHMYPYELLTGLSKENFQVSLLTRKCDSSLPDVDFINEFTTIYRIDYGDSTFRDKRDFYQLRDTSFSLACALLDKYNIIPDIIHSLYWNSGYLAMQLAHKMHIPYVHSPISIGAVIKKEQTKDIEPHRINTEQTVFENAAVIFSITESEKANIISFYGINKEKITIIGRPVAKEYLYPIHDEWGNVRTDNMRYFPAPFSTDMQSMPPNETWWERKAFIYVGRIHHNKGIHHIINAWILLKKQYKNSCPPLWIVGGTPMEINEFHIEHNLHLEIYEENGSIIWWGRLNAEGISSLYTRSLALVMHSKYEPGGRVSMEAMSAALPVIATPCGFAVDTIINWHTGFIVDYGDEKKLAKRMSMFILQPYLSDSMGYNAKQSALNIMRKWNFMEHHVNVYNCLISHGHFTDDEGCNIVKNQWIWGLVHSYPAHLPEMPKQYLLQKYNAVEDSGIYVSPKKDWSMMGYFVWSVQDKDGAIYVYQPYNRINILRLLDTNRYPKIIFARSTYAKFQKWKHAFPSPILLLDDEKQAIIIKQHTIIKYTAENFSDIIKFITSYKYNISNQIQTDIKKFLSKNLDVYEIISCYQAYTEILGMNPQEDFSIALEANWTLRRVKECAMLQGALSSQLKKYLSVLAVQPYPQNIVLGGFVRCKSLCKCKDELCLLIPTNLHPVEDGYDEGVLLLLVAADNINAAFWHSIIQNIPSETRQKAIWWAIVFLAKRLLIDIIMSIYPEKKEIIYAQLDILMDYMH